jgi:hypothetical protein
MWLIVIGFVLFVLVGFPFPMLWGAGLLLAFLALPFIRRRDPHVRQVLDEAGGVRGIMREAYREETGGQTLKGTFAESFHSARAKRHATRAIRAENKARRARTR